VSVTEVGSLACEGMGSLRQEMGQLGAPRDEPVIATAALSVAASDAGTGSLACFASALASAGRYESRYTRGLVALSPLMPLFAGRGR
jgi:aspartate/tyrosine/aromatic aminotransferase